MCKLKVSQQPTADMQCASSHSHLQQDSKVLLVPPADAAVPPQTRRHDLQATPLATQIPANRNCWSAVSVTGSVHYHSVLVTCGTG
jgi:hypothetical protein